MNSTRTCVTPPRDPGRIVRRTELFHEEWNGGGGNLPVRPNTRVTFTSFTATFEESIVGEMGFLGGWKVVGER